MKKSVQFRKRPETFYKHYGIKGQTKSRIPIYQKRTFHHGRGLSNLLVPLMTNYARRYGPLIQAYKQSKAYQEVKKTVPAILKHTAKFFRDGHVKRIFRTYW